MKIPRIIKIVIIIVIIFVIFIVIGYPFLERGYQKSMDTIRKGDVENISGIIMEYESITGKVPFQEQVTEKQPFMVIIGRSSQEEDMFAEIDVLKKGGLWANSYLFEEELTKILKRPIILPRDPQSVPTYAPNVYIYFVTSNQFCVVAHLYDPSEISVKYSWEGGDFYSHAKCFEKKSNIKSVP